MAARAPMLVLTAALVLLPLARLRVVASQAPAPPVSSGTPAPASPDNADRQSAASGVPADQQQTGEETKQQADGEAKKKGLKQKLKDQFGSGCTNFGCWGNDQQTDKPDQQASTNAPSNLPPRSDESSSKDTRISLEPPAGEPGHAPGAEPVDSDVREMQPWDPHKAEKDLEIGDYYFKQKNYPAAISRYREALYWKPNDAMAQFRLGQAFEAVGQYAEARKNYAGYLRILPRGKFASDAEKGLGRLKSKPDDRAKSEGPIL